MIVDRAFLNVMILSWGFMLVFAAFQTMGNIEVSEARDYYCLRRTSVFSPEAIRALPIKEILMRSREESNEMDLKLEILHVYLY